MSKDERHDDGWIAVVGQWRSGHLRFPLTYAHAVQIAGGAPRVLSTFEPAPGDEPPEEYDLVSAIDPLDPSVLEGARGLVLPGGGDIDPAWYGCERHPRTRNVNRRRDQFELTLMKEALEQDIPVLAICHGMQLLNVHFGGTLEQHLADDPRRLDHDRDRPRAEPAHAVRVDEGTLLSDIVGEEVQANSHHHQGLQRVADALTEVAWAEDGVLEAVIAKDHSWVIGVQWHPEAMAAVDIVEKALFEAFVDATRGVTTAAREIRASA